MAACDCFRGGRLDFAMLWCPILTLFDRVGAGYIIPAVRVPTPLQKNPLISVGCLSLVAALACLGLLDWSSSVEQASSPGEKDLGVAVLGMIFGIPAFFLGLAGLLCLVVGICVWAHRLYLRRA
jgi:hypothetical protein